MPRPDEEVTDDVLAGRPSRDAALPAAPPAPRATAPQARVAPHPQPRGRGGHRVRRRPGGDHALGRPRRRGLRHRTPRRAAAEAPDPGDRGAAEVAWARGRLAPRPATR